MDQVPSSIFASDYAWYCARTQPKHEHIAARNLRSRLGVEVFNPRLKVERSTRRGVVRTVEPLFPSYVFVRCDLAEQITGIRHTYGISSLVHFGGRIPKVAEEVVEQLRECFESEEPMEVADGLQPGVQVAVGQGPFLGSHGVVVRLLPSRQRVQILLDFLGRTTVAEVDRGSVSRLDQSIADLLPGLATNRELPFGPVCLGKAV
ncbi:MAG TPA: transcriptional activator RfaH [Verrucomicrobiae bacterium]|nr:transcriptional activator RfaH [Verrucomicrobiae bacterium]